MVANKPNQAYTIKVKKGFNPLFIASPPKGRRKLFNRGLHQFLEAWMVEHPGMAVPSTEIARRFACTTPIVTQTAKKIELHQRLSPRRRGGARHKLTPKIKRIIKRIYDAALPGSTLRLEGLVELIARKSGWVVSETSVRGKVGMLEASESRGVMVKGGNRSVKEAIDALTAKGLKVRGLTEKHGEGSVHEEENGAGITARNAEIPPELEGVI